MDQLLSWPCNCNLIISNNFQLYLGKTSLFYAAERGFTKAVELLIEYGADINTKNLDGQINSIFSFIDLSILLSICLTDF